MKGVDSDFEIVRWEFVRKVYFKLRNVYFTSSYNWDEIIEGIFYGGNRLFVWVGKVFFMVSSDYVFELRFFGKVVFL